MKLSRPGIMRLSEMICGNEAFPHFPHRSSSFLTKFFIDLDFVHDGSTRAVWIQDTLNDLNDKEESNSQIPNRDLCRVIGSLVNPDHFLFDDNLEHDKAIIDVNKVLKSSGLTLKIQRNGQSIIVLLNGEYISTETKEVDAIRKIYFLPLMYLEYL